MSDTREDVPAVCGAPTCGRVEPPDYRVKYPDGRVEYWSARCVHNYRLTTPAAHRTLTIWRIER